MTTIITYASDPALWTLLHDDYISQGRPRNVTRGTELYEPFTTTDDEIRFKLVVNLDYIDSRSLSTSRGATYKNLDTGE